MAAMMAGMGVVFGAASALNWAQIRLVREHARRRQRGLSAVRAGVTLMTAMQQHRGIAAALLNGDRGFAPRLVAKQQEVGQAIAALDEVLSEAPELAGSGRRFASIQQAWRPLHDTIQTLPAEASYHSHTALIQQVLYLLGDVGERAGLLEHHSAGVSLLAESLLVRLPLLAESIGQARALGSGYAAKGKCGAVGRIRLSFLEQRMRGSLSGVLAALEPFPLQTQTTDCSDKVHKLLNVITARIIGVEEIDLAPEVYFATATEAIDACLTLWQKTAQAAEVAESSATKPRFQFTLITGLCMLGLSAGASWVGG